MLVKDYKLDPGELTLDAQLEDLGLDSLGMAELVFDIEDKFGLCVPDTAVSLTTLGEVVGFIDDLIVARDRSGQTAQFMPLAMQDHGQHQSP